MTTAKSKKGEIHTAPELATNKPALTDKQLSRMREFQVGLKDLCQRCCLIVRASQDGPQVIEIVDRIVPAPSTEWEPIGFFEGCDPQGVFHTYDGKGMGSRVRGIKEQDYAGWGL